MFYHYFYILFHVLTILQNKFYNICNSYSTLSPFIVFFLHLLLLLQCIFVLFFPSFSTKLSPLVDSDHFLFGKLFNPCVFHFVFVCFIFQLLWNVPIWILLSCLLCGYVNVENVFCCLGRIYEASLCFHLLSLVLVIQSPVIQSSFLSSTLVCLINSMLPFTAS